MQKLLSSLHYLQKNNTKLITILHRGQYSDALRVEVPDDLHQEWAHNDEMSIDNMRTMGFWVDKTYAQKRAVSSDGPDKGVFMDVISMCTTKENKRLIDKVRNIQRMRDNDPRSKTSREERELMDGVRGATDGIIPTYLESRAT